MKKLKDFIYDKNDIVIGADRGYLVLLKNGIRVLDETEIEKL